MSVVRRSRLAFAGAGAAAVLVAAVPALAASTANESLSNFKITGASSAAAGKVTFKVKNTSTITHDLVVIKTKTKAAGLKTKNGKPVETGKVGKVTVPAGKAKTLTLTLKKGHYALICDVDSHYMSGMHADFTVK
jgi:uncharacterized cupredoxin-like copper-binding protein